MRNESKNNEFFTLEKQKKIYESRESEQFIRNSKEMSEKIKNIVRNIFILYYIWFLYFFYLLTLNIIFIKEIEKYLI